VAAEGGRVGSLSEGLIDRFEHSREVAIHVAVPKAQNAKPGAAECAVATYIARLMSGEIVLAAIDLDNETLLEADEVNNESLTRCLPAEVVASLSP
jgi:hypothetical protein